MQLLVFLLVSNRVRVSGYLDNVAGEQNSLSQKIFELHLCNTSVMPHRDCSSSRKHFNRLTMENLAVSRNSELQVLLSRIFFQFPAQSSRDDDAVNKKGKKNSKPWHGKRMLVILG